MEGALVIVAAIGIIMVFSSLDTRLRALEDRIELMEYLNKEVTRRLSSGNGQPSI